MKHSFDYLEQVLSLWKTTKKNEKLWITTQSTPQPGQPVLVLE